ncbi:MAG: hypothetical protein IPO69_11865 [Saprospiraceae bacterium]|jgi:hypothetical protein|nr:hypothetical protein [Saprospiraceae bacterium]MBK9679552.1 hypothetical protein [Saprospiraceae bacterium]
MVRNLHYQNLSNKSIKIFTRSFSPTLYQLSSELYKNRGIENVRFVDKSAEGFFEAILKDTSCDIAINIDEDAFVTDFSLLLDLVDFALKNQYANVGCPDYGLGCPRGGNPIITNPFFNILNLQLIRTRYKNFKDIMNFDYESHKFEMISKFPIEMYDDKNEIIKYFDVVEAEPYYPFFFWLAYNFKTYYLHNTFHQDKFSTIVFDNDSNIICKHSWLARRYKIIKYHTKRINNLIKEVYYEQGLMIPKITLLDKISIYLELTIRYTVKISYRIYRIHKKLFRLFSK